MNLLQLTDLHLHGIPLYPLYSPAERERVRRSLGLLTRTNGGAVPRNIRRHYGSDAIYLQRLGFSGDQPRLIGMWLGRSSRSLVVVFLAANGGIFYRELRAPPLENLAMVKLVFLRASDWFEMVALFLFWAVLYIGFLSLGLYVAMWIRRGAWGEKGAGQGEHRSI
jgi:hypothetical protein